MTLSDKINADLKTAMKAKDQASLRAIRAIKAAILLMKTENGRDSISQDEEIKMLQKLCKQRKDSIEVYQKQGRTDLANEEKEELDVISTYLPEQLSEDEIAKVVQQIIGDVDASSLADLKKVMPVAMKQLAGKADGKTISSVVKSLLS
jgi:uncharacterized protein YqeY